MNKRMNFNMNYLKKEYIFYLFLYITLIIGFVLGENSAGGAEHDSNIIFKAVKSFSLDLNGTYINYHNFRITHYPFYYIFLSQILKLSGSISFTKLVILHLGLFLPLIFYKIIKIKYTSNNKYLIYLPGILFLSPGYRSASIWGLNDNIALIFFSLSVFFYLKYVNEKIIKKKIIYVLLNATMLAIAAYTRQYYAIFSIFFIYKLIEKFNIKILGYYVVVNIILAAYAIKLTIFNINLNYSYNYFTSNIFNNIALSITMFVVYLLPTVCNKDFFIKTYNYFKIKKNILLLNFLFFITLFMFFDYNLPYGGGIFYKVIYNYSSYLYFLILTLSLLIVTKFLSDNYKNNIILISCLFLAFLTEAVYQKYFEILSIILLFSLFRNLYINQFINNLKFTIKYLYLYFLLIYCGHILYKHLLA